MSPNADRPEWLFDDTVCSGQIANLPRGTPASSLRLAFFNAAAATTGGR